MAMIPTLRSSLAACLLLSLTANIDARPRSGSLAATNQLDHDLSFILEDPWPAAHGMPPQFKLRSSWLLRKRECLENGSNYCFGNNEDSCPDCGGCCSQDGAQWCCSDPEATCCPGENCCEPGTTCCGEGCCAEGQECTDGKCEVPVVTVTETKTAHSTQTRTKVEVVTVEKKVVETSTINSIITTTVTSAQGTHTEITYVTTTVIANAKRAVPTASPIVREEPASLKPRRRGLFERTALDLWRSLVYGGDQAPFDATITQICPTEPRHCAATSYAPDVMQKRQADATSTKTVFTTTTIVDTTTVNDRRTTTTEVTSVFKTTIFQTSTRVIGATATVSTTSTVTITSRTAETQTITSTSTFIDSPAETSPPDDSSGGGDSSGQDGSDGDNGDDNNDDDEGGLSNSAIIGIGVGAGLVALTLAIVAFFFWRRKQKRKNIPQSYDFTYSQTPQMTSPKQPTLPFIAAAAHGSSHTPTNSDMNTGTTPDSFKKGAGAAAGRGHTRNNSSISNTLLNSGQVTPDAYREGVNTGSHQNWPSNASEMPAEPRYEMGETGEGQRAQQPPSQPPPAQQGRPQQYRTGPHPSTSSISRVTRFAELDGGGQRIT